MNTQTTIVLNDEMDLAPGHSIGLSGQLCLYFNRKVFILGTVDQYRQLSNLINAACDEAEAQREQVR